jgi:hypothetical protein
MSNHRRPNNLALMLMVGLLASCGNAKVNTALEQAQVISASAESTFHTLVTAANAMIPLLPADQQAAKRQELTDIALKGDQLFQAESDAIKAALAANEQTFDVAKFTAAIAVVMEDLLRLSSAVGVRPDVVQHAQVRVARLKAGG